MLAARDAVIIAVVLGLAIGVALGALGGGGSILAVPVLAHIAGQSVTAATATSLVAVGAAAAVGSISHARAGRVRWGAAAAFVATGVAGSWAGAGLNEQIDGDVLLLAFSVLVLVAAHRMLTACPSCTEVGRARAVGEASSMRIDDREPAAVINGGGIARPAPTAPPPAPSDVTPLRPEGPTSAPWHPIARVLVAGTIVGLLTGLFGVGGGFVIVPALTLALGLSMPAAIATSLVIIVGNATVALAFRGLGSVDWSLALPFSVTMLAGSFAGSLIAHRLPAERSLRAFAALLVLVAVGNGVVAAVDLLG
jgi:uncharacterized membrane protein YfcA